MSARDKRPTPRPEPGEKCPFGCIFDGDTLMGDCRIPWSKDCALNYRDATCDTHRPAPCGLDRSSQTKVLT